MKSIFLRAALATAAITWAGLIHAALPTASAKHARASVISGMHSSIPPNCVEATTNAINAWNAAGANFSILPDFIVSTPRPDEQTQEYNDANVTIDDGVLQDPRALMAARVDADPATRIIKNADIRVDKRRIRNNDPTQIQLNCSTFDPVPVDVVDWQSAILHEFGHVVGLEHDANDIGCAMYDQLGPGQIQRTLCPAEKQSYIDNYKALRITGIPNVSGPQRVVISAKIFYAGAAPFPLTRETINISCPGGWSCGPYNGNFPVNAPSPLTFNFKCTNTGDLPTSTFGWRTTLIDANGVRTNAVDHTSTCTSPAGASSEISGDKPKGIGRIIIID